MARKTVMESGEPRSIKAVETTGAIINAVQETNGAGVTELANRLDLSKGTVHTHLNTLCRGGYLVKEGHEYYLSLRFLNLGETAKQRYKVYYMIAPELDELAVNMDVRAQVLVEERGKGVCLHMSKGPHSLERTLRIGDRDYLHYSACGKAILAYLPESRVDDIIDEYGLPERTPQTITDPDELFAELERVRERGYSTNAEEKIPGLTGVGVPIQNEDGNLLASISVAVPATEITGEEDCKQFAERLLHIKNIVEVNSRLSTSHDGSG